MQNGPFKSLFVFVFFWDKFQLDPSYKYMHDVNPAQLCTGPT